MVVYSIIMHTFGTSIEADHKTRDNMEKIDKLDRQILSIISKIVRIPFKDVAEECGVSRAAIHQRV